MMAVDEIVCRIKTDGFCVVPGVVPDDAAERIRRRLLQLHEEEDDRNRRREEQIRAGGHRVGARGVTNTAMLINANQDVAPYLADPRVLGTAEAFFGPFVRIASAGSIVTHPGNARGYWHADWPYNQTNASRIQVPYPDLMMVLSTLWMLTPFNQETGGTLLVPRSHRSSNNPSGSNGVDPDAPHPDEIHATGAPGSVLAYDARLWHAVAPNRSSDPRVAIAARYAPWWLNLNPESAGTPENAMMVVERKGKGSSLPPIDPEVYASLPADVRPLFRHALKSDTEPPVR